MTTKVRIENVSVAEHDIEIYTVGVSNLAGRRQVGSEQKEITLKPGESATFYVHCCQDLRVAEKPR